MSSRALRNAGVPALDLQGVSVRRGALSVLCGVDLRLDQGDSRVIFGENGAGKSTLIQVASGELRPDSGSVWLSGRRADAELSGRLISRGIRVLALLEQPGLAPTLSALENVALPLRYHATSLGLDPDRAPSLAREALAALGVHPPDVHSLPDRLSFGMQRRVALARILALRPQIVLLDDPLLGVDSESRQIIERLLRSWVLEPNLSLLCASGDRDLARRLGARAGELSATGLRLDGTPSPRAALSVEPQSQLFDAAGDAGMLH